MSVHLDEKLRGILSDGFNRSLGALEAAGAIDTRKLKTEYCGVGSRYYDLVTEQIELTVKYSLPELNRIIEHHKDDA